MGDTGTLVQARTPNSRSASAGDKPIEKSENEGDMLMPVPDDEKALLKGESGSPLFESASVDAALGVLA